MKNNNGVKIPKRIVKLVKRMNRLYPTLNLKYDYKYLNFDILTIDDARIFTKYFFNIINNENKKIERKLKLENINEKL